MIESPTYLADLLDRILQRFCLCLSTTPGGSPADCFVSHDRPPDDCCDFLAIWLESLRGTVEFPNEHYGTFRCGNVRGLAEVRVLLQRNCYPVVRNDPKNPFPPVADIESASVDLLVDAQVMWCCFGDVASNEEILGDGCNEVRFLRMDPVRKGGCAGWLMRFQLELDPCCGIVIPEGS